jgi:SAM-dependent methyltransferase
MNGAIGTPRERGLPDPPAELVRIVGGGMEIGRWQVWELDRLSLLVPRDRVLDVGSGIGRTALWLTAVLTDGRYEGFDIHRESIDWCQREITSRYGNFRFRHLDLFNAVYNPTGTLRAEDLRFPYEGESFSLVCLFSVFTHLLPPDLERYLAESYRVLRPEGGRIHASCFLLTPERRHLPDPETDGVAATFDVPESMVAYEESSLRERFRKAGFEIRMVSYGTWADAGIRRPAKGTQDVIVAYR